MKTSWAICMSSLSGLLAVGFLAILATGCSCEETVKEDATPLSADMKDQPDNLEVTDLSGPRKIKGMGFESVAFGDEKDVVETTGARFTGRKRRRYTVEAYRRRQQRGQPSQFN